MDPEIEALQAIVGVPSVLTHPSALIAYSQDGYTLEAGMPKAVVLPRSADQVQAIVRLLAQAKIPFLARGSGTSLSGGAISQEGAVIIHLSKMNRIINWDWTNQIVAVEPGVINAHISGQLSAHQYFYAPDPSSQQACTIGGNFAENSGGPHCLKYGVTVNHIVMADVVLADGELVTFGNLAGEPLGPDWLGLLIGSEGTLGIATRLWLKMTPQPQASRTILALFDETREASQAVSDIIAGGHIPAALEMMDRLAIAAVEKGAYPVGYPPGLEAVLLIELDGNPPEVEQTSREVMDLLRRRHVREVREAASHLERNLWWANRKTAFGAMGLISPQYYVQDGVIPRSTLPRALAEITAIGEHHQIAIANVFHAGDGNLHPLLLYNDRDPEEVKRVRQAGSEILALCVRLGGSITGEHGIGLEKREEMRLQFTPSALRAQSAIKAVFDPQELLNPGKVLPTAASCTDWRSPSIRPD